MSPSTGVPPIPGHTPERTTLKSQSDRLSLLISLRWLAATLQLLAISLVVVIWGLELPLRPLLVLLLITAGTNLALPRLPRSWREHLVGATLVLDALLLTGMLGLTGGPANPFSILYLTHVTLAAIIAGASWTWAVTAISSLGYGCLFFYNVGLPPELGGHGHHGSEGSFTVHLQGMWLAYTVAAITIAASVSRLASALRAEREERQRAAHFLGLATLAAGAAHEIGNPLATIRIAAEELEDDLRKSNAETQILDDVRLINDEVGRAHKVLERMAAGAGELAGEAPASARVDDILCRVVASLGDQGERVHLDLPSSPLVVRWPVEATSQAFLQIIRNGLQASADSPVECTVRPEDGGIAVCVRDQGQGMSSTTLQRLGEPFFTTRSDGMGLGVFIARSLVEHLGGSIDIKSERSKGTRVRMWLPEGLTR